MTLDEAVISVWQQALAEGRSNVELEGKTYAVTISKLKGLRMVEFNVGPSRLVGIEQNPKTESNWAALARKGNRIMQFRCKGAYVANVCEGKLSRYPAWDTLRLTADSRGQKNES